MPIFQVYLNGKKVSAAGVGAFGVLGAHVTWVRRRRDDSLPKNSVIAEEELDLHVGGLISPTQEQVRWVDRNLEVGDEVCIRIVENARIDQPTSRKRPNHSKELRLQKQYVRRMAKKLGWKIQTR